LHTNDPVSSIIRLRDLGVDLTTISNCLVSIIIQRLVRKLCKHCKKSTTILPSALSEYEKKYFGDEKVVIYEPNGCNKCINGYWSRNVVSEVMLITDDIKKLIESNKLVSIDQDIRKSKNYRTIYDDAKDLIREGVTSLSEVIRVLG